MFSRRRACQNRPMRPNLLAPGRASQTTHVLTTCAHLGRMKCVHKRSTHMAGIHTRETGKQGETINLGASRKQKALIDQAAEALGRTRSDFMLDTVCREAEAVLLDR